MLAAVRKTAVLSIREITVVRYCLRLRFIFFHAITPPSPNSFPISFGVRSLLTDFLSIGFISPARRTPSIGVTFDASRDAKNEDINTVIMPRTAAPASAHSGTEKISSLPFRTGTRRNPLTPSSRKVPPQPIAIPSGTPTAASKSASKNTQPLICLGVVPTEQSIPKSLFFSVTEMAMLFRMIKMLTNIMKKIIAPATRGKYIVLLSLPIRPFAVRTL